MYSPKLVLSIRQTQHVHREVYKLLTGLRRARYMARQGRTWKSFDIAEGPWFTAVLGLTDLPAGVRQSEHPEPAAEELKALAALAEPVAGVQTWRAVPAGGRAPQTTIVGQKGARSTFEFDGRQARVEGDEGAVAYPGISLVERGAWGEAVRRIVDGRLPWLPHRSRRELARLFVVKVAAQNAQTVQLRLALPGAAAGNELLVTVGRQDGLPTLWECRLDGQPILRLRFEDRGQANGKPIWKKVIAEDAAGHRLEQWELIHFAELKGEIPPLDRGWDGLALFDLREQERGQGSLLISLLQALRLRDWEAADRALAAAFERQPDQPFLLLAKAWCLAQRWGRDGVRDGVRDEGGRHEAEVVELLKRLARGGSVELLRPVIDRAFAGIGDGEIYELLLEQPIARRRVVDFENLAHFALRVGKPGEAAAHLKAAIDAAGLAGDAPERERRLVQLLLEADRTGEAVALAESRLARPGARPEDVAALAETLHQWGAVSEASKLFRHALADKESTGERRQKLLHRRANLESGLTRWRTLLEAVDSVPATSFSRRVSTAAILTELTDPAQGEQAGLLSDETKDKSAAAAFRLRQAELYLLRSNVDAAADIGWKLFESKQLPSNRFNWLVGRLYAARHDARLIQVVEDRLRSGKTIEPELLESAAVVYEAQGRAAAAKRARSNARDFKQPPPQQPVGPMF